MLCPEVWKFPNDQKKTFHRFGCYDNKAKQTLERTIRSSPFSNMVSLIIPGLDAVPETIKQLIGASDYYLIRDLKLSELIRRDFIEAFVKKGKFAGTSLSDRCINNNEDIFVISPEGKLTLLISTDLYQTIGLEGHPVENSKRIKERFEIVIDLRNEKTSEESKSYKRIKNALSRTDIKFNFYVFWEPIDHSVCPSSVGKFFNDNGYVVEQHSLRSLSVLRDDLKLPSEIFSRDKIDFNLSNSLVEYLGILMLGCDARNAAEELNSYTSDPDLKIQNQSDTKAITLHCRGLITSDFILKLIAAARQSVDSGVFILSATEYDKISTPGLSSYITLINDKKYFLLKA